MGQVNVNITARREMAGEKAMIIGKKIKRPPMLELAAEVWNKKKEEKEEKDDRLKIDNEEGLFKSPGFLQSPAEGVDWKPVSPETGEKEEKKGGLTHPAYGALPKRLWRGNGQGPSEG